MLDSLVRVPSQQSQTLCSPAAFLRRDGRFSGSLYRIETRILCYPKLPTELTSVSANMFSQDREHAAQVISSACSPIKMKQQLRQHACACVCIRAQWMETPLRSSMLSFESCAVTTVHLKICYYPRYRGGNIESTARCRRTFGPASA